MPTTIIEFVKSRTQTYGTAASMKHERVYKIFGTTDDDAAMTLLLATAPTTKTIGGVLLSDVEYEVADADHEVFECAVNYKKREKKQAGDPPKFSFETTGQNVHITTSLATVQAVGGSTTDFRQAIGFDEDTIQGTDIIQPVYNFSENHTFAAAYVTQAYKLALYRATGKTNNAVFKGFQIGEALFLGGSGSTNSDGDWDISYRFAASENATGLIIGTLTGINKKGWEYLWCRFSDDVVSRKIVKRPTAAYVEQVYKPHDFSTIGIGTT